MGCSIQDQAAQESIQSGCSVVLSHIGFSSIDSHLYQRIFPENGTARHLCQQVIAVLAYLQLEFLPWLRACLSKAITLHGVLQKLNFQTTSLENNVVPTPNLIQFLRRISSFACYTNTEEPGPTKSGQQPKFLRSPDGQPAQWGNTELFASLSSMLKLQWFSSRRLRRSCWLQGQLHTRAAPDPWAPGSPDPSNLPDGLMDGYLGRKLEMTPADSGETLSKCE